jgi:TRAP-type uncharacterized transport system fused permease subunit
MFVLDPSGTGLLLGGSFKNLAQANWGAIAVISVTAIIGIVALAGGLQGWLLHKTNVAERWMLIIAGLALVYPTRTSDIFGFGLFALVLAMQKLRSREPAPA